MQFPADFRGLLPLFSLFLFDIPSRSQFLSTPPYFYANLDELRTLVVHSRKEEDYVGSL